MKIIKIWGTYIDFNIITSAEIKYNMKRKEVCESMVFSERELLGLSPCFDHNMALISRGYPSKPKKSDMLIVLFNELMDEYPMFKSYIPKVDKQMIFDIIEKLNMSVRTNEIVDLIMERYKLINE